MKQREIQELEERIEAELQAAEQQVRRLFLQERAKRAQRLPLCRRLKQLWCRLFR